LFIYLTGTDLHGGVEQYPNLSGQLLEMAERLIVAQPACLPDLPEKWRSKTSIVYPSVELPDLPTVEKTAVPLFTNVGHLRQVKNPHLMFHALQSMSQDCLAMSLGIALDRTDGQQALLNQRQDERYRWKTDCDRPEALAWMKNSIATMVNKR
jgi:hypothetical protein